MRLLIDREISEQVGSLLYGPALGCSEVPILAPPLAEQDGMATVLQYADRLIVCPADCVSCIHLSKMISSCSGRRHSWVE